MFLPRGLFSLGEEWEGVAECYLREEARWTMGEAGAFINICEVEGVMVGWLGNCSV